MRTSRSLPIAAVVLVISGFALFQFLTARPGEAPPLGEVAGPSPTLDTEFPPDFPVPAGARLLSSFRVGSSPSLSLGVAWSTALVPTETEDFYRRQSTGRWTLLARQALLRTTTLVLSDAQRRFGAATVDLTPDGAGTRISALLAPSVAPPSVAPVRTATPGPTRPPIPRETTKPSRLPPQFVPPDGVIVDAFEQTDGRLVAVGIETRMSLADATTFYRRAIQQVVGAGPEESTDSEGTVLSWNAASGSGFVVLRGARPVEIRILLRR